MEKLDGFEVVWVSLCGMIVFSMQAGFAMLEVASVRKSHIVAVLSRNILDTVASYLLLRLNVAIFSPSLVVDDGEVQYHLLLWQVALCCTSVTICSGTMAERVPLLTYLVYAMIVAGFIYPTLAESAWGKGGLLRSAFRCIPDHPYHDFAGGGVVHVMGGVSAIAGNVLLGRRILQPRQREEKEEEEEVVKVGREEHAVFDSPVTGWPRKFDDEARDAEEFKPPSSLSYLQVLGTFFLWFGWYGFNAGSTLGRDTAGKVVWTTTVAAAAGGAGSYFYCCTKFLATGIRGLDLGFMCNGVLGGLVAVTAGCDVLDEGQAMVVAFFAGFLLFPLGKAFCEKQLLLDDPVDAIAVHSFCGAWGIVFLSLASARTGCVDGWETEERQRFCSVDFSPGRQLAAQLIGLFVVALWTFALTYLLFFLLSLGERVRAEEVAWLEEASQFVDKVQQAEPGDLISDETMRLIVLSLWHVVEQSPGVKKTLQAACSKEFLSLSSIKEDLAEASRSAAATALEKPRCDFVLHLSRYLHRRGLLCAVLPRLRVPPKDELRGVLHVDPPKLVVHNIIAAGFVRAERVSRRWPKVAEDYPKEFGGHPAVANDAPIADHGESLYDTEAPEASSSLERSPAVAKDSAHGCGGDLTVETAEAATTHQEMKACGLQEPQ